NGPESFTMDNLHLLGPTPEVDNFYVACGMNSKGIGGGGGVGKIMADWVIDGYPSGDVWECDVRRSHPVQRTQSYVESRIPEALGHSYDMHWPFYQYHTARNLMLSPLHETLKQQGACFGEVCGYERANWFTRDGAKASYQYSYKRQNWFEFYRQEHLAVRESLGLFDMSSFAKFEVSGPDSQSALQYICAADMNVEIGKVVYTQWLDIRGGINADLSIVKVDNERFWVVTSIGSCNRDWWHLKQHLRGDVQLTDISMQYACLSLQGPNARKALEKIVDCDVSSSGFAFGVGRFANIASAKIWLQRLSYVGELGWEIFIAADDAVKVFNAIQRAGTEFDIRNAGLHALNSLRLEKGFRHWGHDIGAADNLIEAGLGFVAKPDAGDFIGREAFLRQKAAGLPARRLLQFLLDDPEPLLYHNEPIIMDGTAVGYLTSAMYAHSLDGAIGMGYVSKPGLTADALAASSFEIEIAREKFTARASLKAFYDPTAERMKV
ncbi:MAG: FAD-dependent oxidoreductase, partial [Gammaproteobacteria bacterium]|nr:FAD-dependent oxidoreductase [Gammaproteobacteria bacterium]